MADLGIEMDQQFSLELIRNGLLCCDIEDAIRDATQAVTERGKAATVTIKLTVKPATKSSSDNVITVFVKILQKNWLGVFLSLKNLSRGFAPTLRYPRIFF